MLAADRDLLVYEPQLFNDVRWAGQTILTRTGAALDASGHTITLAGAPLAALGIAAGSVAIVSGVPVEVLGLESPDVMDVSLPRARSTDEPIPLPNAPRSVDVIVATFRPQFAVVNDAILHALGIEPDPQETASAGEASITNPGELRRVVALGALHAIYAAASALADAQSPMWAKAVMYRERFIEERRRVRAHIDLDADGKPDATRTITAMRFVRS